MQDGTSAYFELELALPDSRLCSQADSLVGFTRRYENIHRILRLLLDKDGLERWSMANYKSRIALIDALRDRYPLMVFHGDVGTGKTATAEAVSDALTREMQKEAWLFKLSTRVRGSGSVGEMSTLINQAFEVVVKEAGKGRLSFMIIDEADSLAADRSYGQSHHEDKVAVNTLIQKIDDIRRLDGRVAVFLCTNRLSALDPAILRRAAHFEEFQRPDDKERLELLNLDCRGLQLDPAVISEMVKLTGPEGPHKVGYSYSDIRTRLLPDALARAFPDRKVSREDLIRAMASVKPSPSMKDAEAAR